MALVAFTPIVFGVTAASNPKNHPYRQHWKKSVVGKGAVARVTAGAAMNQARHRPSKYGGGAAGFGKRLGAGFASNAVGRTVEHGVAAKLHEDLHYHRSNERGVGRRLGYALKSRWLRGTQEPVRQLRPQAASRDTGQHE